jgi:dihydropteroate synthase
MGILNVTPDSMFDGGRYTDVGSAVERAEQMVKEGAAIIDIGGESTRPQAKTLSAEEELARVLPVIKAIRKKLSIPLSIDTSQPLVMREAIAYGVNMINDVRALRVPHALETAAALGVPVCLMHMSYPFGKAEKETDPLGVNPIDAIKLFFQERIAACEKEGIPREKLILDPGFGAGTFGKSAQQNLSILKNLSDLKQFELPLLVGVSYKTFLSEVLAIPLAERLSGALAATVLAVERGARLIRTHDVKVTKEAVKIAMAVCRL